MNNLLLAWRLLKRDWHVGELRILIFALLIAVASITSIGLFTQRIQVAIQDQSGRFLGADLLLSSPQPVKQRYLQQASKLQLQTSQGIQFASVLVANDQFQLASIKAIDRHYPLRGTIKISAQLAGPETEQLHGPEPGQIWLSSRLFQQLNIDIGDRVELGETHLIASAHLQQDPGQAGNFLALAPRALMHMDDIPATGIVKPGSRLRYQYLFAGRHQQREAFERWLKPKLNTTDRLIGGKQGSLPLRSAMDRAEQYLAMASMLSVLLAGIAIAMAANRYSQRHYDQTALMRCMGASQSTLLQLYAIQVLLLGVLASILGCLLGYISQEGLVMLLADFIPSDLPPVNAQPFISGFISGIITLTGFSLPAILRLKTVSPLRVLRRELTPLPLSAFAIYSLALGSLITIMWWQSGNFKLTAIVLIGILAIAAILNVLSYTLMRMSTLLLTPLSGPWRSGLQQLIRHRQTNQIQILAFGMALMILITILLLRTDLLDRWQAQLPEQAPNHFVINIQTYEVKQVQDFFQQHQIHSEGLFPMVRGRISALNNEPVRQALNEQAREDESLKRELNLSWATHMQAHNRLTQGQWWQTTEHGQHLISIEQRLAQRLGIALGDRISFQIADQTITATVTSLRSVQWDSFQPNFYIIFPPGVIEQYPVSFISSFYLPPGNKQLINILIKQHPGVTVIEIDAIMNQVRSILTQATLAIEYVMLFVLFAGLMVLLASIQSSMDERLHEATILRTLGARKDFLRKTQLTEFSLMGLFAGILAVAGAELVAYGLYTQVFSLDFEPHIGMWLIGICSSMIIITISGLLSTRKVVQQSPMKTLQSI